MFRLGFGPFFLFLPLVFLIFAGGLFLTNGIFPGLALLRFTRFSLFVFFGSTCPEASLLILGLLFLRAGGHNGIELGILRETVNKRYGHISKEQKPLAGIGVGHIGKLVGTDT